MGTRTKERHKRTEFFLVSILLSICLVTFGFPAYLWNLRYQDVRDPYGAIATTEEQAVTSTVTAVQTSTAIPSSTPTTLFTPTPTATLVPTQTLPSTVFPSASPTLTASSMAIPATATRRPRDEDPSQPAPTLVPPTSAPTQPLPESNPTQAPPTSPPSLPTLIGTLLP
jgi:hypothetical protein